MRARSRPAARAGLVRPAVEFWSAVLPPLLDTLTDTRTTRVRSGVRFQKARVERRLAGLRSLEGDLGDAETPPSTTPVDDPYDTTIDGSSTVDVPAQPPATDLPTTDQPTPTEPTPTEPTPTEPTPTEPTPTEPTPTEPTPTEPTPTEPTPTTAGPSVRVLYDIFDRLESSSYTEGYYPRVSVVNAELEDEGEPRTSRDTMRPVFDNWLHDRIEDGVLAPPTAVAPASSSTFTDATLFSAFDALAFPGDYTKDEPHYPLVSAVERALRAAGELPSGTDRPNADTIHAAFGRYPSKPPGAVDDGR